MIMSPRIERQIRERFDENDQGPGLLAAAWGLVERGPVSGAENFKQALSKAICPQRCRRSRCGRSLIKLLAVGKNYGAIKMTLLATAGLPFIMNQIHRIHHHFDPHNAQECIKYRVLNKTLGEWFNGGSTDLTVETFQWGLGTTVAIAIQVWEGYKNRGRYWRTLCRDLPLEELRRNGAHDLEKIVAKAQQDVSETCYYDKTASIDPNVRMIELELLERLMMVASDYKEAVAEDTQYYTPHDIGAVLDRMQRERVLHTPSTLGLPPVFRRPRPGQLLA